MGQLQLMVWGVGHINGIVSSFSYECKILHAGYANLLYRKIGVKYYAVSLWKPYAAQLNALFFQRKRILLAAPSHRYGGAEQSAQQTGVGVSAAIESGGD